MVCAGVDADAEKSIEDQWEGVFQEPADHIRSCWCLRVDLEDVNPG